MSDSSKRQSQLTSYFSRTNSAITSKQAEAKVIINESAERLGFKLGSKPIYITDDSKSWYILVRLWLVPESQTIFEKEWMLHPPNRRKVKIYGKTLDEKRWSQAWGVSMAYSGLEQTAKPIEDSTIVPQMLDMINELMEDVPLNDVDCDLKKMDPQALYNACLQNWYLPEDTMGLHSDDESYLIHGLPIFSLSWGGTRRFLLRRKGISEKCEIWLENGDLLVMGGLCQDTHKHEVPKIRSTMDPPTSNRINWTIRAIKK